MNNYVFHSELSSVFGSDWENTFGLHKLSLFVPILLSDMILDDVTLHLFKTKLFFPIKHVKWVHFCL